MEPLRIQLFGRLQARSAHSTLGHLSMRRVGALLACLVLRAPNPVPREELLALLWPEEPTEIAQNRLRVLLSALRKQVETGGAPAGSVLVAERGIVQIAATAFTSDYHDFLQALRAARTVQTAGDAVPHLENAAALYQGELLAGYSDEWILIERNRLAAMRYQALRDLVHRLTQTGEFGRAIDYARQTVAAEPFDEEAHRDLIRLYREIGQPSAALRQYGQLKRLLLEEMRAEPSAEMRALAEEIEAGMGHGVTDAQRTVRPMTVRSSEQARPADTLPPRLTRFIARAEEVALLREILAPDSFTHSGRTARLVTVLGPGGMGKTRLAIEAAEQLKATYGGRVYFAPLAEIADPNHVGSIIARTLRLPPTPGVDPLSQAIAALGCAPALLVLDNMEHLLPEAAPLVEHLLFEAPSLRCLLTSRQSAGIEGEQEFALKPLRRPETGAALDDLSACPAVALFVDRVRLVRSDFVLTEQNAADVIQLCRALEGVPLAIELAAARARVMTPGELRQQTGKLLNLLVDVRSGKMARHRSLRATLEWSFQLLALDERRFFIALSVFAGGFTAEAARYAALGDSEDRIEAIAILERLRAASLLTVTSTDQETTRFGMLETLREFGTERLVETGKELDVRARHLAYFATIYWETGNISGVWDAPEIERVAAEDGNLREALEFGLREDASRDEQGAALRLAVRLSGFWDIQGRWTEGRAYLRRASLLPAAEGQRQARVEVLRAAGILANQLGDHDEARALSEQGLALALGAEDSAGIAGCLRNLGSVDFSLDDYAGARARFEQALRIYQKTADARNIAACQVNLSGVAFFLGDHKTAQERLEEALSLYRQFDDRHGIASALLRLGNVRRNQSYFTEGRACFIEAMDIFQELGHRLGVADCLESVALIAALRGDHDEAFTRYTHALELFQKIGSRHGINACIYNLGGVAHYRGDFAKAIAHYREVMEIYRRIGDRRNLATCLFRLGNVALDTEDFVDARACYTEGLTIEREISSRGGIANCLTGLGRLAVEQNEPLEARRWLSEALAIYYDMDVRTGVIEVLEAFTCLALGSHQAPLAARLAGAAIALRIEIGFVRPIAMRRWQRTMDTLRATLGEDAFAAAWREGEALSWAEATAAALQQAP